MENEINEDPLVYLKYEGYSVKGGYLDLKKSAEVLNGFDESLRFFLSEVNPSIQEYEFEIPIRIRKGSWEAFIPQDIGQLFLHGLFYWGAYNYTKTAVTQLAENDFKDIGFKTLLSKAFKAMQSVVKLANHVGTLTADSFKKPKFKQNNQHIGIKNSEGEVLWIPKEHLEYYTKCPKRIFKKLASIIEEDRELIFGLNEDEENEEVYIPASKKYIYSQVEEDDEILFPHLEHGQPVKLKGHVTRANENSNTIGFLYKNHVLTCEPVKNNVKSYKQFIFTNCIMEGRVDRLDRDGNIKAHRPRIRFHSLSLFSNENNQKQLFE